MRLSLVLPLSVAMSAGLVAVKAERAMGREGLPPGFVRLSQVAKEVRQEIRYAGTHNFVGRPVAGYGAAECWLRREAAEALALVVARPRRNRMAAHRL
jgi:D-alanyl-D-alanine dipeptidase